MLPCRYRWLSILVLSSSIWVRCLLYRQYCATWRQEQRLPKVDKTYASRVECKRKVHRKASWKSEKDVSATVRVWFNIKWNPGTPRARTMVCLRTPNYVNRWTFHCYIPLSFPKFIPVVKCKQKMFCTASVKPIKYISTRIIFVKMKQMQELHISKRHVPVYSLK